MRLSRRYFTEFAIVCWCLSSSNFSGLDLPDGADPTRWFLDKAGVAMSPGRAFGTGFDAFCRLNLATGRGIEEQTVERLRAALTRLRR